ncbi:C-type lectin domain family 10 member A-like protein [Labeo rohita]|uniref:C-type lectin domain family 10 member A-like protein n=1 Tax=Labeo rohita TaxID=84645 RepID=A0A498MPQ0_LABRO|nr:C-type lectin domain family 10 member A-like protein [Labeo rohita]
MAEFKHIQDSSSDSQSNFYCILKEDTNTRPSRTRKDCLWSKEFCFLLICGIIIFFVALLITVSVKYKPLLSCKAGWQLFLSNCYKFSSDEKNWQTARSSCSGQGALLLILGKDSREWDFIVQHAVQSSKSYWIGLTDAIAANWRWVDGTPYTMNSSQWEPGEPNNSMGNEDCGELTKSGKLNDARCSRNFNFICKAPASEN